MSEHENDLVVKSDSTSEEVAINTNSQMDINRVRWLSPSQWNECIDLAVIEARSQHPLPKLDDFLNSVVPEYPEWVTKRLTILLFLVAIGALVVSAGKQFETADMVLSRVTDATIRVSQFWQSTSLIVLLGVGELGSLLFSLAAGIFGAESKANKVVFRSFQILSAIIAIGGNIASTALHTIPEIWLYQWFLTLFLPTLVLGLGLFLEHLLLSGLQHRAKATLAYNIAVEKFKTFNDTIHTTGEYLDALARYVLNKLQEIQANQLKKTFSYSVQFPEFRRMCLAHEWNTHMLKEGEIFHSLQLNPTYPRQTGG